jgi:hypothetical protein
LQDFTRIDDRLSAGEAPAETPPDRGGEAIPFRFGHQGTETKIAQIGSRFCSRRRSAIEIGACSQLECDPCHGPFLALV